ncbi:MAG TPA: 3-deoxy-manno-octulosonate cytidylyltransferase [Candidatus Acidoferrales bacterium]|nr:3-deoxy-manno-octulosonate cytidylyltransferase [Candidatus Acidoferrales bacterium]
MAKNLKTVAIIPARYASTRFPGKPLTHIAGTPMIQHVYERVSAAKKVDDVFVATDDKRIAESVSNFGGKFVMTPSALKSGTDRCAAAAKKIKADVVVNVQGDEPVISPKTIDAVISVLLKSRENVVSTAAVPIHNNDAIFSENTVKVVVDRNGDALYFSRSAIPFLRGVHQGNYSKGYRFLKHLGIYVYRNSFLQKLTGLKETPLETAEKLEQLRVLENGYKIKVAIVDEDTISVDVPSDIIAVEDFLSSQSQDRDI